MSRCKYFIVNNDGSCRETSFPFPFAAGTGSFLIRKKVSAEYSYGEHASYQVVDCDGNDSRYRFGEYYLESYETCGTQQRHTLKIRFIRDLNRYEHSLYKDGRWGTTLVTPPYYDNEWEGCNPSKTVCSFMNDVRIMGYDARIMIDRLKRELFETRRELSIIEEANNRLRTICRGAVLITIPDGVSFINGDCFDDCTSVERIIIPASVSMVVRSAFNWKPTLKQVVIKGNRVVPLIASLPSAGIRGSNEVHTSANFYVEGDVLNKYQKSIYWRDLITRVFPLEELND